MDAAEILNSAIGVLKAEAGKGYKLIRGFAETELKDLAERTEWLANERANGSLKKNTKMFEHFLRGIEKDTKSLARDIAALTILTIEKAWNAIVNVLWGGISAILKGAGVPASLLPTIPLFTA